MYSDNTNTIIIIITVVATGACTKGLVNNKDYSTRCDTRVLIRVLM